MSPDPNLKPTIMWFRQDLRVSDNPALGAATAAASAAGAEVLCVYVRDRAQQRSHLQLAALDNALYELNQNLDGNLLTLEGDPVATLIKLAHQLGARSVHAANDYTPAGQEQLEQVRTELAESGTDTPPIPLVITGDPYAVAPGTLLTGAGSHYRVFTPFSKQWMTHPWKPPMQTTCNDGVLGAKIGRTIASSTPGMGAEDAGKECFAKPARPDAVWPQIAPALPEAQRFNPKAAGSDALWTVQVGEESAQTVWQDFLAERLLDYATGRDMLAQDGTSRMSIQLAHGTIHPRKMLADLADADEAPIGRDVYAKELAWREFYADFLAARPETGWHDVNPVFPHYPWDEDEAAFAAWREGRTGFPVVDAAMRQLAETGWMHNRARMIVASFLTKDLHQPWQLGAKYFLSQLVDADFASNQHGWQWTAGTGTDASPYFRIFNPYTQGLRFDPQGQYIYRWIPQLRSLFDTDLFGDEGESRQAKRRLKQIHYGLADGGFKSTDLASGESAYPRPIVDHGEAREESLRRYKER